ncbi:MAG: hypothetical protein ACM3KR_08750 [Deltaproteobacteria bacterium]
MYTFQNGISAVEDVDIRYLVHYGEHTKDVASILEKNPHNNALVVQDIAEVINDPLKAKTYLLSSDKAICQTSPIYTVIRAKCIFCKNEEGGLAVKDAKWYWQDVEFLTLSTLEHDNTTRRIWVNIKTLNNPQPYTFN